MGRDLLAGQQPAHQGEGGGGGGSSIPALSRNRVIPRRETDHSPLDEPRPPSPPVIIALLNAKNLAAEHEAHIEHMKEENGGELPERIVYVSPPHTAYNSWDVSFLLIRTRCLLPLFL